ncbi:MAG: hypothetical protein II036_01530 [Oscillospiraceae bacterium]|nr:hypothetical protein [Oscillospiraceae bacterium]
MGDTMQEDENLIKNRLSELARRSYERGIWVSSEFLSLSEQDILLRLRLDSPFTLEGGCEGAERRLAHFGSEETCGWREEPPIVCVKIAPVSEKFAEKLTHRDFLGALMGLGIRREVLGDIVLLDNCGYLFCLDTIAGYVTENLTEVRRTTVRALLSEPPASVNEKPPLKALVTASERLDAVISAVYKLSRSQSQELISAGRVFISGRLCDQSAAQIPDGAVISVRSVGRFIYEGIERETKKGRLRVLVRIY